MMMLKTSQLYYLYSESFKGGDPRIFFHSPKPIFIGKHEGKPSSFCLLKSLL
jgi:hypothetical protein